MLNNLYWMKYSIDIAKKAPRLKLKTGVVLVSKHNELICSAFTEEEPNASWYDVLLKKINDLNLSNVWSLYITISTLSKVNTCELAELFKVIHIHELYVGLPDFRLENYLKDDPIFTMDYVYRYPDNLQREILKQNKYFYTNSKQSIKHSRYYSGNRISNFILEKLKLKGVPISTEDLNANRKSTALASLIFNRYGTEYKDAVKLVDNTISEAFNNKYSAYDYLNDARSFDTDWKQTFESIYSKISTKSMSELSILNVGVGSGNEAITLFSDCTDITFVDIAKGGLERIQKQLSISKTLVSSAENLSFASDNSYELYISLRTYNSSFFDIDNAISEAYRVLKKKGL